MFVETRILISNNPQALVIPRKSIAYKENQPFVFVFQPQSRQVQKRDIQVGITEGDMVEVLSGLQEGEMVVSVGTESLKDQMRVKPVQ